MTNTFNSMESSTRVFADGALFSGDGKLLLLKRLGDGVWELPCGELDFGEEPEVAASRVFLELTGIDATPDRPLGAWGNLSGLANDGAKIHEVHVGYTMSLGGALLGVELERERHNAFAWVTSAELGGKLESPSLRRACERAFAALARGRKNK